MAESGEFRRDSNYVTHPHHRGRPGRLPGRAGPVPAGGGAGLSVGQPRGHRAPAARPGGRDLDGHVRADARRAQLDVRPRPGRPRPGAGHRAAAGGLLRPRSRATSAASPCRRSSTCRPGEVVTNDFAQMTHRPVAGVDRVPPRRAPRSSTRSSCATRSTRSTQASSPTSTTASTAAGFAGSQEAYEQRLRRGCSRGSTGSSERLADQRYLVGDTITEADVRLFTTLARFDAVYHGHFKCNRQKLTEMPVLWAYARDLFQTPGFGDTIDFDHIKRHYYVVHRDINPTGIVPDGPGPVQLARPRTAARSWAAGPSATAPRPRRRRTAKPCLRWSGNRRRSATTPRRTRTARLWTCSPSGAGYDRIAA